MRPRRGVTLLEVVLAVTVAAVVGLAAASALQAASVAAEQVTRARRAAEGEGRLRTLLTDAARHIPPASMVDGARLRLDGDPARPVLRFASRGVVPPFGTGAIWWVTVWQSADSLLVETAPPAMSTLRARRLVVPRVATLAVRVLDTEALPWHERWSLAGRLPQVLEVAWTLPAAAPPPLRVRLAPLGEGTTP
jgi:prepilin-type N-terminal cleavage/methylation domain-containing protein